VRSAGKLRILSGTSAATPFVTAAIAADPALQGVRSIDTIRSRLASNTTDLGPAGKDEIFGAGLVRAPESCMLRSG
jgi:subtilisin family serine protease